MPKLMRPSHPRWRSRDPGPLCRRACRLGLSGGQVAALCASCPSLLVSSVDEALAPMVAFLHEELGCGACPGLLQKLVTKGGVLTRSLATVQVGGSDFSRGRQRVGVWGGVGCFWWCHCALQPANSVYMAAEEQHLKSLVLSPSCQTACCTLCDPRRRSASPSGKAKVSAASSCGACWRASPGCWFSIC